MNKDTKKCLNFVRKQFKETTEKSNISDALDMLQELIEELKKEYKIIQ